MFIKKIDRYKCEISRLSCEGWMDVPFSQTYKTFFFFFTDVSLLSIIPQREFKNIIWSSNQTWSIPLRKEARLYFSFLRINCQSVIAVSSGCHNIAPYQCLSRYKLLFSLSTARSIHIHIHTHTHSLSFLFAFYSTFFLASLVCSYRFPIFISAFSTYSVFSIYSFYFARLLPPSLLSYLFLSFTVPL